MSAVVREATWEFDPCLVEQAVFHAVRGAATLEQAMHQEVDALYALPAGPGRERRFQQSYGRFFTVLELDRPLRELLGTFPLVAESVQRIVVREAAATRHEGAELLVRERGDAAGLAERTLMVQLTPQHVVDVTPVRPRLLRDLLHVADMLDPDFGYDPDEFTGHDPVTNLARDRYRVLWDIYVEVRLHRAGLVDENRFGPLLRALAAVCPMTHGGALEAAFETLRHATTVTHADLVAWTHTPQQVADACLGPAGG